MRTVHKYRRYTKNDILTEAHMYCIEQMTIVEISERLKVPCATISWHLLYPLKDIDYRMWVKVRCKCLAYAKKPERYMDVCDIQAVNADNAITERVCALLGKGEV